jgi:MYXO-CTERM domain-containing protein
MRTLPSRLALFGLTALAPSVAFACGGFFCSRSPVDQEAERIVFRQVDERTVESYVEIQYQGDPGGFAWVVPVPSGYLFDQTTTFPSAAFNALDLATEPVWLLPDECAVRDFATGAGPPSAEDDAAPRGPETVEVIDRREVDGYEVTTVKTTSSEDLVEWLRINEYRIVPAMEPFIALYVGQGLNFVAAKLLPGEGLESIKPLKMVYRDAGPMVPLRLTSLAAVPEMGVKVFLLGQERYGLKGQPELEVDTAQLRYDTNTGRTNYGALVARTIDAAGGQGMVVDFAGDAAPIRESILNSPFPGLAEGDTEDPQAAALGLFEGVTHLTRFYGRFSPEEMTQDLSFVTAPGAPAVPRERQLERANVPLCDAQGGGGEPIDVGTPCDYAACGQGGLCVTVSVPTDGDETVSAEGAAPGTGVRSSPQVAAEPVAACACVDGSTARVLPDPTAPGGARVSCVDTRLNFPDLTPGDNTPDFIGVPPLPDACAQDPCGKDGTCLSLNGSQTCQCNRGFVAIARPGVDGQPVVTCQSPDEDVPDTFYRRTLPEPALPYPGKSVRTGGLSNDGCSVGTPGAARGLPALGALALLVGLPLLRRRRH